MHPPAVLALLLSCTLCGAAAADDWIVLRERVATPHRFDDFTVVRHYDGRDGTPEWSLVLERDGREVGRFGNASAEQFHADPEHGFVVGVSNTGLPDTAVIVFDAHGTPIVHWAHTLGDAYCQMSVTIVRKWVADPTDAVFEYETTADGDVRLRDITLVGCDGERFSLDAASGGEFAKALAAYRALPAVAARADAERDARE